MAHIKYNKIYALGKDETRDYLEGDGHIVVEEKIDGANTSVWLDNGKMCFGTRNTQIEEGFNGFIDYVKNHEGIHNLLAEQPRFRLFGEWLVKHTLSYNETAYREFYLYDILDEKSGEYLPNDKVRELADKFQIKKPHRFYEGPPISEEKINEFVGKSVLGDKGEGVVIKRHGYVSPFDVSPQYAKIVTQHFKENNAVTFGGNNKYSETYNEMYIVNKYLNAARVQKIIQKIESTEDRPIAISDTPRVAGSTYHDMLTEEIWDIQDKVQQVNFRSLRRLATKKIIQIFHDILSGEVSIADEIEETKK